MSTSVESFYELIPDIINERLLNENTSRQDWNVPASWSQERPAVNEES